MCVCQWDWYIQYNQLHSNLEVRDRSHVFLIFLDCVCFFLQMSPIYQQPIWSQGCPLKQALRGVRWTPTVAEARLIGVELSFLVWRCQLFTSALTFRCLVVFGSFGWTSDSFCVARTGTWMTSNCSSVDFEGLCNYNVTRLQLFHNNIFFNTINNNGFVIWLLYVEFHQNFENNLPILELNEPRLASCKLSFARESCILIVFRN